MSISSLFLSFTQPRISSNDLKNKNISPSKELQSLKKPFFIVNKENDTFERMDELEEKKFIKEHSLLSQASTKKTAPLSTDLLGQIHADAFAKHQSFEHASSHESAIVWEGLIDEVKEVNIPGSLKKSLSQYVKVLNRLAQIDQLKNRENKIIDFSKEVAQQLADLKPGESFLLEGGRRKDSFFCPIVFEFIRSSEKTFDLFVYYTGKEEGPFRNEVIENGKKKWIHSYIYFKDIPCEEILFAKDSKIKSDFIYTILSCRYLKISSKYLCQNVLGSLSDYRQNESSFISKRQANTEAWSSLKSFVRRRLGFENYKKVVFEIKLMSLIDAFYNEKNIARDDVNAQKLRSVLRRGATLVLKNLISYKKIGIKLSENLSSSAHATALDILNHLDHIEERINLDRKQTQTQLTIPSYLPKTFLSLTTEIKKNLPLNTYKSVSKSETDKTFSSTLPKLNPLPPPKDFFKYLDMSHWQCSLNEMSQSDSLLLSVRIFEVEHRVSMMPIPSSDPMSYWHQIPKDDLMKNLISLHELMSSYHQMVKKKSYDYDIRQANTMYALLAIINQLAIIYDNSIPFENPSAKLENYSICFEGIMDDYNPYTTYFSFQDYQRKIQIANYFKTVFSKSNQNEDFLFECRTFEYSSLRQPEGFIKYFLNIIHDSYFIKKENKSEISSENKSLTKKNLKREGNLLLYFINGIYSKNLSNNFLMQNQLGHIAIVAQATLMANLFSLNSKSSIYDIIPKIRFFEDYYAITSIGIITTLDDLKKSNRTSLSSICSKQQKLILNHPATQKVRQNKSTEIEAFVLKNKQPLENPKNSNPNAILCASCVPSLLPYQLLSYFRNHPFLIESFEDQILFEIMFFRSFVLCSPNKNKREIEYNVKKLEEDLEKPDQTYTSEKKKELLTAKHFFPLKESLNQKFFLNHVLLFIREGVDYYFFNQPHSNPKVIPVTFFIRLACRLSSFYPEIKFLDCLDIIEKMLLFPSITSEEKNVLFLHLILVYRSFKRELNEEEITRVFTAWAYHQTAPCNHEFHHPEAIKEAELFVHYLSVSRIDNLEKGVQHKILKAALEELGIDLSSSTYIKKINVHCIHAVNDEGDFWQLNTLTGEITSTHGFIKRAQSTNHLQESPEYKELFKGIHFDFFENENAYYFSNPKLGTFRALFQSPEKNTFIIQKKVNEKWYQFIPANQLSLLPLFLRSNKTHWIQTDKNNSEIVIFDQDTSECFAIIDNEGEITSADKTKKYSTIPLQNELNRFENLGYVYWIKDQKQKTVLVFERYFSVLNHVLSFELIEYRLVFVQNKNYFLSKNQKVTVFGPDKKTLTLSNSETGDEKILVSMFHAEFPNSKSDNNNEIREEFRYFEFDFKLNRIIPVDEEGTIYLVWHFLVQKQYVEALDFLKKIDFRSNFSLTTIEIFKKIFIEASLNNVSPEAAAIALHTWVLLKKAENRKKFEKITFDFIPDNAEFFYQYCRFEHQISEDLLLNPSDQALCGLSNFRKKELVFYPIIKREAPFQIKQRQIAELFVENSPLLSNTYEEIVKMCPNKANLIEVTNRIAHDQRFINAKMSFFNKPLIDKNLWSSFLFLSPDFKSKSVHELYTMARIGSENEKQWVAFNMRLIDMDFVESLNDSDTLMYSSLPFIQLALNCGEFAPELPPTYILYITKGIQDFYYYRDCYVFFNDCFHLSQQVIFSSDEPLPETKNVESSNEFSHPIVAKIISPRMVESLVKPLRLLSFSEEIIDNGFVKKIFNRYFTVIPRQKNSVKVELSFNENALSKQEEEYLEFLQNEFKNLQKEYEHGTEINQQRQFYALEQPQQLRFECENEIKELNEQIVTLEVAILEMANQHDRAHIQTTLLKDAKVTSQLTLKKLIGLFLKGDAESFYRANPYLRNSNYIQRIADCHGLQKDTNLVIDLLYNKIGLYMALVVYQRRLQRAKKLCEEIEKIKSDDVKKEALVQKLAQELSPLKISSYSIAHNPPFLVYEYLAGISIRPLQAQVISNLLEMKEGKYIHRVIQLGMGEGKTSVIAAVILVCAAKPGRLSVYTTLASQHTSVYNNFKKIFWDHFEIELEEVEVKREQLVSNSEVSKEICSRLEKTMKAGNILIVKAETLQTIGLCFEDLNYQISHRLSIDSFEKLEIVNKIKDILIIFLEYADATCDEIDLLMYVLFQLNFTLGQKESLVQKRVEIVQKLFQLLMSTDILLGKKQLTLKEKLKIHLNEQNLLPAETFSKIIPGIVSKYLSTLIDSPLIKNKDFEGSFRRYINGTMNPECEKMLIDNENLWMLNKQDRNDYKFLKMLHENYESDDPSIKETIQQLTLIKLMVEIIFPETFEKTANKNYGRGLSKIGDVRPYDAVNVPSENCFAFHWEAVAYHFLIAVHYGIEKEQLLEIAKKYKEKIESRAYREKIAFEMTPEAIEFKSITKVLPHEIDNPKIVEQVLLHLKQNLECLLKFEVLTIMEHVGYYPHRLTSTGQCLIGMLDTVRAMSGTPWNIACYPEKLSKNFNPTKGIEGQIIDEIEVRVSSAPKDKKFVHIVQTKEMTTLLKTVLDSHPGKHRIRCILDSGAFFKNYSNLEVAFALRDYFQLPVLFFMRDQRVDEKKPDTLAVLTLDSNEPDMIGFTRIEDIQKKGLNGGKYITFFDERHAIAATDIQMDEQAIGLMTVHPKMLRRSYSQTILRLREFYLRQQIEFVIPESLIPNLEKQSSLQIKNNELLMILNCFVLATKNQTFAISDHYLRSCKDKIDFVFKENFSKDFLIKAPLTQEYICEQFPSYESSIVSNQSDDLFKLFGSLRYMVPSIENLKVYRDEKLKLFPHDHPRRAEIEKKTQEIVDKAEKSGLLPKSTLKEPSNSIGKEVSLNLATQVEVEVQQDITVYYEDEIAQEHPIYTGAHIKIGKFLPERTWSDQEIKILIEHPKKFTSNDFSSLFEFDKNKNIKLFQLRQLFNMQLIGYLKNYESVFSIEILGTFSWARSAEGLVPVFNEMQRPLNQVLIISFNKQYQVITLSQYETIQFKKYLDVNKCENVWLIQVDGTLLHDAATAFPIEDEKIQDILLECNVFNGNIEYLEAHKKATIRWLYQPEVSSHIELKKRFLKIKVFTDPLQKEKYLNCNIFHKKNAGFYAMEGGGNVDENGMLITDNMIDYSFEGSGNM